MKEVLHFHHLFPSSPTCWLQSAAATRAEADKTFADVTGLAKEVDDMMKQLQDAEKELKRKQADAEQDMRMAGEVSSVLLRRQRCVQPVFRLFQVLSGTERETSPDALA